MTSPVDTSVKYFHSGMTGAPVLSGTAGALIAVLDACLVNGFGLKTVDSLVVAGDVATMTIASGHSAEVGAVQLVAGAIPAALNGEQKVTAVTATTIKFATTGIADQAATGAITTKVAPAGWAKAFSGTNVAAYKPTDVTATGCLLRVDDTVGKTARVVGYETMSDVNTGAGPFPTATQQLGGGYWTKSQTSDATARKWILISDGRLFYFARSYHSSGPNTYETTVFGDYQPTKLGDVFACALFAFATDTSASGSGGNQLWAAAPAASAELYCPRAYTGIGSAAQMRVFFPAFTTVTGLSGNIGLAYPNPEDGGLYVSQLSLLEQPSVSLRGAFPGAYAVPQIVGSAVFAPLSRVQGVAGLPGRTLLNVTAGDPSTSNYYPAFVDITGPWR